MRKNPCAPQLFNQEFNYLLEEQPAFLAESQSLFKIDSSKPESQGTFFTPLVAQIQKSHICGHKSCASARHLSLGPYEFGAQKQQSWPGGAPLPSSQAHTGGKWHGKRQHSAAGETDAWQQAKGRQAGGCK